MKKVIIPATILCTVICIGLHIQPNEETEPAPVPTPLPLQVEASVAPTPKIEIVVSETEEPVIEINTPMPTHTPTPTLTPTATPMPTPTPMPVPTPEPTSTPTPQTVQAGDLVYVPGFGWLESQGEGTVIYDELMYENGNKVGIMD